MQISTLILSFNPFFNSLNLGTSCSITHRRIEDANTIEAVEIAVTLLGDEFNLRQTASESIPLEITLSYIRTSISKYNQKMLAAAKTSVCCSCGRFVLKTDIYEIND